MTLYEIICLGKSLRTHFLTTTNDDDNNNNHCTDEIASLMTFKCCHITGDVYLASNKIPTPFTKFVNTRKQKEIQ